MRTSKLTSTMTFWLIVIAIALMGASCNDSNTNTTKVNTGTTATPTSDPCVTMSDDEIVDAIYSEIAAVRELRGQIDQIDVVSAAHQVSLWGWVATDGQRTQVIEIATKSKCVTGVNADQFYEESKLGSNNPLRPQPSGGCLPGYTPCGDICIPQTTGCSIGALVTSTPAILGTNSNAVNTYTNTAKPANTNSNAKTNTNKGY